jgi:hypothetical protein
MSIRDACIAGISPTPNMRIHVVSLENGNIAVAAFVPGGQHTPFICADGRVYRRSQDSSDPVFENDRHSFDQIVERGRMNDKEFDDFCMDERAFSQSENDIWLSMYLSPYPDNSIQIKSINDLRWHKELLAKSLIQRVVIDGADTNISGNLPFDTIMPSGEALILKQVNGSGHSVNRISMTLDAFGRCKLRIPVIATEFANLSRISQPVMTCIAEKIYSNDAQEFGLKFIDIGPVLLTTMNALAYYGEIISPFGELNKFRTRVSAKDIWRTVPLIDSSVWCDHVAKFGFPVNMSSEVSVPGNSLGGNTHTAQGQYWIGISLLLTQVFGIHYELALDAFTEIIDSANRHKKQ